MPARPKTRSSKSGTTTPTSRGKPAGKAGASAKKVPRSRTFTGCRTCRGRHLKCDEVRPVCSSCRRLNLVCEGYDARLLWVPDPLCSTEQRQSHRGTSYRYPLFTEKERSSMSVDIVDSMGDRAAADIIFDIDERDVVAGDAPHLAGPFGVFRAFEDSTAPGSPPSDPSPSGSSPNTSPIRTLPDEEVGDTGEDVEDVEEVTLEPWSVDDNSLAMGPYFPPGSFYDFNTDSILNSTNQPWTHGEGTGDLTQMMAVDGSALDFLFTPTSPRTPDMAHAGHEPAAEGSTPEEQDSAHGFTSTLTFEQGLPAQRKSPTPFTNHMPGVEPCLPAHAASLLRYYKSMEESSSSVKGVRISPWQLWLLPCALETFAELSLWNTTSHTRHSILCTLLAKSAFHLHQSLSKEGKKEASPWFDIGRSYQKSAQSHLKLALQGESGEPGQAKYNEMLIAILATAMVSVMYNGSRAVKIFLLDAERLIRLRGLAMPKSFHVRVLHHVYTHLRVIAESTDIAIDTPKTQAEAATEMAVSLRKFRIAEDSLGADLDLSREKPAEVGYSDIHLDISGHWPATMYPDIYGVPESLMTLLSQTISFANEKVKLEAIAMYDSRVSLALPRHIKKLEQNIWSWSLESRDVESGPSRPRGLVTKDTRLVDHPAVRSLTLAMHQALIIYFYRRVHNLSAMVVQDSVRKTLDFIQPCLGETADDHDFATSIGWAGFVAACEAMGPDLQERGRKVLEAIDNKGVIFGTDKPSTLAQSVWDRRRETGDWTLSWPDLMPTVAR
ncbi:C6 transcription factor [Colletotrichum higginsianum IMI 349063]|uniref:C6 transcription factor n=2 Tax=Colletotrichum higginsianum TaxID=80884 RepID=A0A1B7Y5G5_COLHI|nr:C6 transcription factor [Colletotrichum higginsianum IMI 349063]OBR07291.1 C6 transcription factor [Colletotrichum higginsianum IMI 349063]TIC92439.1 Arginine metabolism regulation protein II [Colletotrichum higginsianum]